MGWPACPTKNYLKSFYYEVLETYDDILKFINDTLIPLASVKHVASTLLDSNDSTVNFFDDRSNPNRNMRKMFSRSLLDSVHPSEADLLNFDKQKFLNLSNDLTFCLMWFVYHGAGGGHAWYWDNDTQIWWKKKDIFIDPIFRRLEILSTYCKSGSNGVKVKVMDKCTSDYLFHYLFVMRPIQIYFMNGDFTRISRTLLGEKVVSVHLNKMIQVKVRGPRSDDNAYGKLVLKFLFSLMLLLVDWLKLKNSERLLQGFLRPPLSHRDSTMLIWDKLLLGCLDSLVQAKKELIVLNVWRPLFTNWLQ